MGRLQFAAGGLASFGGPAPLCRGAITRGIAESILSDQTKHSAPFAQSVAIYVACPMLFASFCVPIPFLRQQQWTVRSVKGLGGFGLRRLTADAATPFPGLVLHPFWSSAHAHRRRWFPTYRHADALATRAF